MANQISSKKRLVSGILSASMVLSLFTGFSGAGAVETEPTARAVGVTRSGLQRDAQVVMSKENLGAAQIAMPMVIDKTSIGFTGDAGEQEVVAYMTDIQYLGLFTDIREYAAFFPASMDLSKATYLTRDQRQAIAAVSEGERLSIRAQAEAKLDLRNQFIWESTVDGEEPSQDLSFEPLEWTIYDATESSAPMIACRVKVSWTGEKPVNYVQAPTIQPADSDLAQLLGGTDGEMASSGSKSIYDESPEIQEFLRQMYEEGLTQENSAYDLSAFQGDSASTTAGTESGNGFNLMGESETEPETQENNGEEAVAAAEEGTTPEGAEETVKESEVTEASTEDQTQTSAGEGLTEGQEMMGNGEDGTVVIPDAQVPMASEPEEDHEDAMDIPTAVFLVHMKANETITAGGTAYYLPSTETIPSTPQDTEQDQDAATPDEEEPGQQPDEENPGEGTEEENPGEEPGEGTGEENPGEEPGEGTEEENPGEEPGEGTEEENPGEEPGEGTGEEDPGEEPGEGTGEEDPGEEPGEGTGEENPGEEPGEGTGEENPGEEPGEGTGEENPGQQPGEGEGVGDEITDGGDMIQPPFAVQPPVNAIQQIYSSTLFTFKISMMAGDVLTITADEIGLASITQCGVLDTRIATAQSVGTDTIEIVAPMNSEGRTKLYAWDANQFRVLVLEVTGRYTKSSANAADPEPKFTVPMVSTYNNFSLALKADGTVSGWGDTGDGQLGAEYSSSVLTPQTIYVDGEPMKDVKMVAVGMGHSLALLDDGTVYAWGNNTMGQLGINNDQETVVKRPTKVRGIAGTGELGVDTPKIIAISAGANFSMALDDEGHVYTWGSNDLGQLGLGDNWMNDRGLSDIA